MFIGDMNIGSLMVHIKQVEKDKAKLREEFRNKRTKTGGSEFSQQKSGRGSRTSHQHISLTPSQLSFSAPTQSFRPHHNQRDRASGTQSQGSVAGGRNYLACNKCGRNHLGESMLGQNVFFGYGQDGHKLRECPFSKQGKGGNQSQSTASVVPVGRPTQQGATTSARGGQFQNNLYALGL